MKELILWSLLAIPKPVCIDKDRKANIVEAIHPVTKKVVHVRIGGEDRKPIKLVDIREPKDGPIEFKDPDHCYDVYRVKQTVQAELVEPRKTEEKKPAP